MYIITLARQLMCFTLLELTNEPKKTCFLLEKKNTGDVITLLLFHLGTNFCHFSSIRNGFYFVFAPTASIVRGSNFVALDRKQRHQLVTAIRQLGYDWDTDSLYHKLPWRNRIPSYEESLLTWLVLPEETQAAILLNNIDACSLIYTCHVL